MPTTTSTTTTATSTGSGTTHLPDAATVSPERSPWSLPPPLNRPPRPASGSAAGHGIDPLIRRVGALAIVIAMCVPVALSLRGSGSSLAAMRPGSSGTVPTSALGEPATQPEATAAQTSATQSSAPTADPAAAGFGAASIQTTPTQPEPVTAVVTVAGCTKEYTVVAGDYWILIAKKVSVGLNELLDANNATTDTALYPGRTDLPTGQRLHPHNSGTSHCGRPRQCGRPRHPGTGHHSRLPTTTVPVRTNYTRAEVEAIIREIWPDDLENEAVRIATRENHLQPTAQNFCCYGLFQIYWNVHKRWLAAIGVTSAEQLLDP